MAEILHNKELHKLHSTPNIISKRCVEYVVHMRDIRTSFWSVIIKENDYLEDLSSDGKIILKQISTF